MSLICLHSAQLTNFNLFSSSELRLMNGCYSEATTQYESNLNLIVENRSRAAIPLGQLGHCLRRPSGRGVLKF